MFLVCVATLGGTPVQAQTTRRATLPNPVDAPICSISEFRTLALSTHDPMERTELATQWLRANANACSVQQILLISSNRPQWLGASNDVRIAGVFDKIIEGKLKNDPVALKYMYGSEGAAAAGGSRKADESSASASPAAAAPAGPGNLTLAVSTGPTAAPVGGAPAPAPGQSINISLGASGPPPEDLTRKLPADNEPKPTFPPERGTQMKNYFGKLRAEMIRNFFMESISPGNCPEGLSFSKTAGCESKSPVNWKFGEALPSSAKTFPIAEPLLGKLSFYPGYKFVRFGTDILALEKDSGKVADAVLNLGKGS
ncbi:MAG: hypothetical protein EBT37_04070 [Betaproteobacteria bacterium]|nr:hypothetical protein [Betaproteobacteria bacterium]